MQSPSNAALRFVAENQLTAAYLIVALIALFVGVVTGLLEVLAGPEGAPRILDRWWPWLAVAGLLILLAYGPPIAEIVSTSALSAPGYRVW
jgi:hypothetical protein